MKYICVTHVDSKTGIPGHKAPMRNGPAHPKVKGLNLEWWDQSRWPLTHPDQYPRFYGTCDDDADTNLEGVIMVFQDTENTTAKEQYDAAYEEELRARLPSVATPLQIRLALIKLGMLDTVQNFIAALEEPAKTIVLTEWEYALEINKNSTSIQSLATRMGLTTEQLDNIFVEAVNISPGSVDPFDPFPETSEGE